MRRMNPVFFWGVWRSHIRDCFGCPQALGGRGLFVILEHAHRPQQDRPLVELLRGVLPISGNYQVAQIRFGRAKSKWIQL